MIYIKDVELKERARRIKEKYQLDHIDLQRVVFFKSRGTKSKRVIGRCWSLPKIWQQALKIDAHYAIEVISERYDTLNEKMKDEVILHELLHIPKGFGGGLRHHKQLKKALEELR